MLTIDVWQSERKFQELQLIECRFQIMVQQRGGHGLMNLQEWWQCQWRGRSGGVNGGSGSESDMADWRQWSQELERQPWE